jgi:hypothetical protein
LGSISNLRILFFRGILSQLGIVKDDEWKKIKNKYKWGGNNASMYKV